MLSVIRSGTVALALLSSRMAWQGAKLAAHWQAIYSRCIYQAFPLLLCENCRFKGFATAIYHYPLLGEIAAIHAVMVVFLEAAENFGAVSRSGLNGAICSTSNYAIYYFFKHIYRMSHSLQLKEDLTAKVNKLLAKLLLIIFCINCPRPLSPPC